VNFVGPPRPFTSTVDGRAQWVLGTRLTSCITSLESSFNAHVLAICWVCVAQVQKRVELNRRHFIYLSQEEVDLFPVVVSRVEMNRVGDRSWKLTPAEEQRIDELLLYE
jgi:hypothetical protein